MIPEDWMKNIKKAVELLMKEKKISYVEALKEVLILFHREIFEGNP